MIIEAIILFCSGVFFGAALYISLVQHPATLAVGLPFGARFFAPMYKRAAPMQIILAVTGFMGGLACYFTKDGVLWLVGAVLLISVVPITLIFIKPINDILLTPDNAPDTEKTQTLLVRWGAWHWWRTAVSGAAFVLYLCVAGSS